MPIIKDATKENLIPVGLTEKEELQGLSPTDRIGNMYITGRSGTGKTITIENMVVGDIWHERGGLLIDPYGDIVNDVLEYIPADKKNKVAVFEVTAGTAEDNIKKFEQEIDLEEMKKDDQKFLLCKLRYTLIGTHEARSFGLYLLKRFYEIVGQNGSLANRSIYIDEIHNFIDDETLALIKKSVDYQVAMVIADQRGCILGEKLQQELFPTIIHLLCFSIDQLSAISIVENFAVKLSVEDIKGIEKYHFYAKLTIDGNSQPEQLLKGVFPLSYPKAE